MLRKLYYWTMGLAAHRRASTALGAVSFVESSFFPIPPDVMLVPMVLAKPNLPASPVSAWTSWRDEFDVALSDEWIGLRTPGQMPQFAIEAGELRMIAGPAAAGSVAVRSRCDAALYPEACRGDEG